MRDRPDTAPETERETSLHGRALENLDFIRATMERTAGFTAVPGLGGMVMGAAGFVAGGLAMRASDPAEWLVIWLVAGLVGFVVGVVTIYRKARRAKLPLMGRGARAFGLSVLPSVGVGALLTAGQMQAGVYALLPATWLLLYGVAVLTAGMHSLPLIRRMGAGFLLLGALAMMAPEQGDVFLMLGFGGLNLGFGVVIWRRHGG